MSEALLVKVKQACPRDPQMVPPFFGWIYSRSLQFAIIDQVTDRTSGDGEEPGDIADFNEGRNKFFLRGGTICNHRVEFPDILTRL
jgi:hypothetical protein